MKRLDTTRLAYDPAPHWAGKFEPPARTVLPEAVLVILRIPSDPHWTVASKVEADAIANPQSFMGDLMRPFAGLLPLIDVSTN